MRNYDITDIEYGQYDPYDVINDKYYVAYNLCKGIWESHEGNTDFQDTYHTTITKCLETLKHGRYDFTFLKNYFFKAFRINMVRHYGYSFNKYRSGILIEDVLIPVENNYDEHIDGFGMLDVIMKKFGEETRDMLWDNLNGFSFRELDKMYDTNTQYCLKKVKKFIKNYYLHEGYYNKFTLSGICF